MKVGKPSPAAETGVLVTARESREHSLYDFLARPIPLLSIPWNTTDAICTIIPGGLLSFPTEFWSQTMWAEKMKGFRFFRGDLHFQIQVNASPFDQGRLWAFWSPFDAERGDLRPVYTRTNITGYPGVEIDVGNMMTAELHVPYVSPFSHIDQLAGNQPYGVFRLMVLSPFASANDTSVNVTVFCWMDNCELSIPIDTPSLGAFRAQMNSEAQFRSSKGLITGGAHIVGEAAKTFANTPVIGEVAKPLGWLADAVKGTANLLGLSKPVSLETNNVFQNVPGKGWTNCDGVDYSVVLGAKHDNEVQNSFEVFGTKEDEMNIPYIISKPNFCTEFNWTTGDAPRTLPLKKFAVHAGMCGSDVAPTYTASTLTPTHMALIASMFRYWRGGISFRMSCVKNQYYSGRLIIVYYPGIRTGAVVNWGSFDAAKCYQWIWDVKRDTEIQLTIPYTSNLQWLRTDLCNPDDGTSQDALTVDTILGTIAIFVGNELRGPASVPNNFNVQIWVHGASDMCFAVPDFVKFQPVVSPAASALLPTLATPSASVVKKGNTRIQSHSESRLVFKAQMLRVENTFDTNHRQVGTENPEGSSLLVVSAKNNMNPEKFCIGEIHNNLRPFTRRFGLEFVASDDGSSPGYCPVTLDPANFFSPSAGAINNPINYLARMYVFYRGSMRYKYIGSNFAESATGNGKPLLWLNSSRLLSASPIAYNTPEATPTSFGGRFTHVQDLNLNPIVEVSCPYYSNVPIYLISKTFIFPDILRMLWKSWMSNNNTFVQLFILKAGGDDFSFGYLAGAPLLVATGAL